MAKVEPQPDEKLREAATDQLETNDVQKEPSPAAPDAAAPDAAASDAEKGQSAQPGIQDVAAQNTTGVLVDQAVKKRNKALCLTVLQASLGLVTLTLDIVGILVQADETCDNQLEPVGWGIWFTVHAAAVGALLVISLLVVYASSLLTNQDAITAQVHAAKGKQTEAAQDQLQALPKMQEGKKLLVRVGCIACLLVVFALVWFIIGIVLYTKSDIKACDKAKTWFWVIIAINFAMSGISSALKPKKKEEEA